MTTSSGKLSQVIQGKRVVITGGTGSLGKALTKQILADTYGRPERVTVFSRDEARQHEMRMAFRQLRAATEEIIYEDFEELLEFQIGDVRNFHSVARALRNADVVFNAAALKQVPTCEYFPSEAVQTNVHGAENIVRAIETLGLPVDTVIGISTDKACKPVNVMGMSKAIQERIFVQANLRCPDTRFVCVRYGNVLASRGSVIPLFQNQILAGGPVTITSRTMTRFLLSLSRAERTIMDALLDGTRGQIFVPRIRASLITNLARALIGERPIDIVDVGIRPGEKVHEILVAEDEIYRTLIRDDYYVINPILPELATEVNEATLSHEYSSEQDVMDLDATKEILKINQLMLEDMGSRQDLGEVLQ